MLTELMGRERALAGLSDTTRRFKDGPNYPVLQDVLAVLREHAADVGRHHAGGGAQEQRGADLPLDHLNAPRQRRLAQAQHHGRTCEAAKLRQHEYVPHLPDFQGHASSIWQS
jgi:hypothetical protein